jgi:hypothetical protein
MTRLRVTSPLVVSADMVPTGSGAAAHRSARRPLFPLCERS